MGSDGHIEETLQSDASVDVVVEDARKASLVCSLAKSELFVTRKKVPSNMKLHIEGREISEVMALKI